MKKKVLKKELRRKEGRKKFKFDKKEKEEREKVLDYKTSDVSSIKNMFERKLELENDMKEKERKEKRSIIAQEGDMKKDVV